MGGYSSITFFPPQKKSTKQKTKEWMEQCIEAAESFTLFRDQRIRQTQYNKKINYDLYNDILDQRDMERICNPYNLQNSTFPAKMQNYPIANPKIDLLVGEEYKRKFDWRIRVTNDDAISQKQGAKRDKIIEALVSSIQNENFNEQQAQKRLKELNKYLNFEFQDFREISATRILKYLTQEQELNLKFNQGFTDALIAGEEIYCADIVSGEPVLRRVNPLNLFNLRSGDSHYIEDSDMIIEYSYEPIGKVIDFYYEYLTPANISELEEGNQLNTSANTVLSHQGTNPVFDIEDFVRQNGTGSLIEVNTAATRYFGGSYDSEGNVKVVRVVWKSRRKIGKLKYYDEDGDVQETVVDEQYKPNKAKGEEVEWLWINEWWEGTKIGEDIYVKMQPRPIQFRKMTNLSYCAPGYVGTLYATNDSGVKSLMDRMKPYQYLYNVFMYRTELAFAKAKGKIAQLDLSLVPDGWEVDKWLYYAEVMGWAPVDYFNVGKKGAATGKLRGNMTGASGHQVLDMEMGNYIQQHIGMLSYLENQMGEIAGVSKQRQGQIENRELVGNVEHAVTQSSHITEKWFAAHDHTKLRAMATLLETAKFAWRNNKKKLQYVTDELQTIMFEVDGKQFNEAEYGLFVSNSGNDKMLEQALKQLAHAGLQNDKLNFSTLMDIYYSDSISSVRRKIEAGEQEKLQRDQQQIEQQQEHEKQMQQQQMQMQQEALQRATEDREDKQSHEKELKIMDNNTKLEVAYINSADKEHDREYDRDQDDDGILDDIELQKLLIQQQKMDQDFQIKQQKLQQDEKLKTRDLDIKEKALKQRGNAAKK